MLTLLKYDLKSNISRLFASIIIMLCAFVILLISHFVGYLTIETLVIFAAVISTIASFGICAISLIAGFYSAMAGNHSYLTYTIPYKTSSIVLSKLAAALLWLITSIAVIFITWGIYFQVKNINIFDILIELQGFISFIAISVSGQFLFTICQIIFCVSLAVLPIFRNRGIGVIAAIVSYVILNTISGFLILIGIVIYSVITGTFDIIFSNTNDIAVLSVFEGIKYPILGTYLVIAVSYILLSIYIFDKHRTI